MENNQFFALVGATGSGKNTVLDLLQQHFSANDACAVPCDSIRRVPTSFTRIQQSTCARKSPIASLLDMWASLTDQIESQVLPALEAGQRVIMNGFGGTAFAEASVQARGPYEKAAILKLHKTCIDHCVLGIGVPPPIYIWLHVSPQVALRRRRTDRSLPNVKDPLEYIEELNKYFDFYGRLPGQTVHKVDADQPLDMVVRQVLSFIAPDHVMDQAA